MKKMSVLLLVLIIGVIGIYKIKPYYADVMSSSQAYSFTKDERNKDHLYYSKTGHKIQGYFMTLEEAIEYTERYKRSIILDIKNNEWVWNNYAPFIILTDYGVQDFETLESAIYYAKRNSYSKIYWKNNRDLLLDMAAQIPNKVLLDVPLIQQYPELPRGCEVTSLAMILQYVGRDVSKLELAKNIKRDSTPYTKESDGKIRFGNPYNGFVGDMYNISNNGYGVYHGPIAELLEQYMPGQAVDITGISQDQLLFIISKGMPIWVVANSRYQPLEEKMFEIWHTPTGIVKTTYRQHAVIITGYSEKSLYINDPLKSKKNIQVPRDKFLEAWIQMGHQAVIVYK